MNLCAKEKKHSYANGYILNLVSCHADRGVTKHYGTKVGIFFEKTMRYGKIMELLEWMDGDIPESLISIDKVKSVIDKHT